MEAERLESRELPAIAAFYKAEREKPPCARSGKWSRPWFRPTRRLAWKAQTSKSGKVKQRSSEAHN